MPSGPRVLSTLTSNSDALSRTRREIRSLAACCWVAAVALLLTWFSWGKAERKKVHQLRTSGPTSYNLSKLEFQLTHFQHNKMTQSCLVSDPTTIEYLAFTHLLMPQYDNWNCLFFCFCDKYYISRLFKILSPENRKQKHESCIQPPD